jgi:hypothetical protein
MEHPRILAIAAIVLVVGLTYADILNNELVYDDQGQ